MDTKDIAALFRSFPDEGYKSRPEDPTTFADQDFLSQI